MTQSVWHKRDIAQIGSTLIAIAPSYEFAAGVAALCNAVGAPVQLPDQRVSVVVIDHSTSATAQCLPTGIEETKCSKASPS